ncbi:hypothetical protein D3C71_1580320 [compost metagenome]
MQVAISRGIQAQDAQANRRAGIGRQRRPPKHQRRAVHRQRDAPLLFQRRIEHGAIAAAHVHPCHCQHFQQCRIGQAGEPLGSDIFPIDGVPDVARIVAPVHIDVHVARALGHAPSHDIQEERGQGRRALGLPAPASRPGARRGQLAARDHQQQGRRQRVAGRLRQPVSCRAHQTLDLVDGIALQVFLDGEDGGFATFKQHGAQPAGQ